MMIEYELHSAIENACSVSSLIIHTIVDTNLASMVLRFQVCLLNICIVMSIATLSQPLFYSTGTETDTETDTDTDTVLTQNGREKTHNWNRYNAIILMLTGFNANSSSDFIITL